MRPSRSGCAALGRLFRVFCHVETLHLTIFPKTLRNLTEIRNLRLDIDRMRVKDRTRWTDVGFSRLTNLQSLDIREPGTHIRYILSHPDTLPDFSPLTNLRSLSLRVGNGWANTHQVPQSLTSLTYLGSCLKLDIGGWSNLQKLTLDGGGLWRMDFLTSLQQLTRLRVLPASDYGGTGARSTDMTVLLQLPQLQQVSQYFCFWSYGNGSVSCKFIEASKPGRASEGCAERFHLPEALAERGIKCRQVNEEYMQAVRTKYFWHDGTYSLTG